MHPTNTNQEVVYLGLYEKIIYVWDDHNMVFQEGGNGTLWMNPQEILAANFGDYDDTSLKDNTNAELLGNIKSADVVMYLVKGKRLGDMQDISCENVISITNIIMKEKVKVWTENPEVILQVLC